MPQFKIRPGESFLDSDGSVKTGGQLIELDADMAKAHRDKIEPQAIDGPTEQAPTE